MNKIKVKSHEHVSVEFPKGKYYLGDLYYVLTKEQWQEIQSQCSEQGTKQCYDGEFSISGEKVFMASTAYGVGVYLDNFEMVYGVSSGSIGLCPLSILSKDIYKDAIYKELGGIIERDEDFKIETENGYFEIYDSEYRSYLVISTGYDEDYDEDHDEEDDY